MTETEKIEDWRRLVLASPCGYQIWALDSCYRADGERVLGAVLKKLKLTNSVDLVKFVSERR